MGEGAAGGSDMVEEDDGVGLGEGTGYDLGAPATSPTTKKGTWRTLTVCLERLGAGSCLWAVSLLGWGRVWLLYS